MSSVPAPTPRPASPGPKLFTPSDDPPFADGPLTVRELFELYLHYSLAEGVHCPAALEHRRHTFALFCELYGDMPVTDCKPFHLADWIDAHANWKSPSTRRAIANGIRAAFQWALDGERIARNPFRSVHYGQAPRRPCLPDSVLAEVLECGNKRYEQALRFLRLTGCRLSEMAELTWPCVDLAGGLATIEKHKSRRFTNKAKIVILVPEAVELLKVVRSRQKPDYMGHVFLNNRGTAWNRQTMGQQFRRTTKRYGIDAKGATTHSLRHQYATVAVEAGAPLKMVSMALGHASQSITEAYYVAVAPDSAAVRAAAVAAQAKGGPS